MKKIFSIAIMGLSALSFAQNVGDTYIIETSTPGVHLSDYTANGMALSTARVVAANFPELTAARTQSAYCTLALLNKTPKFTPSALPGPGLYKIEYCFPNNAANNATDITWVVESEPGISVTGEIDHLNADNNQWMPIGGPTATFALDSADGSFLQFNTATANGGVAAGTQRFYIDAVKFTYTGPLAAPGVVVEVDGVGTDPGTYATLSEAVAFTETQEIDVNPHQIRVVVDSTPLDSGQIVITKPTTIIGDADENSVSCDIPVDAATIEASTDAGAVGLYYIEIAAEGDVVIEDLNIHTNGGAGVAAIATLKPTAGVGNYTLDNVKVSGSAAGAFLPIDTGDDQLVAAGSAVWRPTDTNAAVKISNDGGAGTYNATLNNCHAGVSDESALLIANTSGITTVNGGAYAHVSGLGSAGGAVVNVTGTGVTFTGSETNRVRVFRGHDSENLKINTGAVVDLMEYVDSGLPDGDWVASAFAMYGGTLTKMEYCRGFSDEGAGGAPFYAATTAVANVFKSTFHAAGTGRQPASITNGNNFSVNFTDCIFTSGDGAAIYIGGNVGPYTFLNCALPTDLTAGESLPVAPITFQDATASNATEITAAVSASPLYSVPASTGGVSNYDWADGADNSNFLRPTNSAAYTGAGTLDSNLTGGASGTAVPVTLSGFSIE